MLEVQDFDLKLTVDSGQIFRFQEHNGGFLITNGDLHFFCKQEGNTLIYKGISKKKLMHFFRLDTDHNPMWEKLLKDKHLKQVIPKYKGLRLIRQDPWEALISFVCSQNSNIPRIQACVKNIAQHYGEKKTNAAGEHYTFPKVGTILDEQKLRELSLGYRAKYIHHINTQVTPTHLQKLKSASFEETHAYLTNLKGIADKVAQCIMLYGFDFQESFPVDVWIERALKPYFPKETNRQKLAQKARAKFKEHSGYAQQYLFVSMIR